MIETVPFSGMFHSTLYFLPSIFFTLHSTESVRKARSLQLPFSNTTSLKANLSSVTEYSLLRYAYSTKSYTGEGFISRIRLGKSFMPICSMTLSLLFLTVMVLSFFFTVLVPTGKESILSALSFLTACSICFEAYLDWQMPLLAAVRKTIIVKMKFFICFL